MNRQLFNIFAKSFKIVAFSIIILSFLHCVNESDTGNTPVVNIEKGLQSGGIVKLSDMCSSVEYIPLQTEPNSIIGRRPLLKKSGKLFYITYINSDKCMVFDSEGLFRNTIGRKGNAIGEYSYINDLNNEEDRSNIAIRDFNKIVIYNSDGLYIKEIPFNKINEGGYRIENLIYIDGGKYWCVNYHYKNDSQSIAVFDSSGDVLLSQNLGKRITQTNTIEIDGKMTPVKDSRPPYIYRFENSVRYVSSNNDTIFSFSNELVKTPSYIINLGSYKGKEDVFVQGGDVSMIPNSFREGSDYLFFKLIVPLNMFSHMNSNERIGFTVYDKTEDRVTALPYNSEFNANGITNDIDNGIPFWPDLITGNKMYQIVDALTFIDKSMLSGSAKMKEIASTLTENSNPVIVVATFK